MRDLYAVVIPKGRLCPGCAEKKYGHDLENLAEDGVETMVLKSDAWRYEAAGPCSGEGCDEIVGG